MSERSSVRLHDLVLEALAGVLQRPTRSLMTMLGAVLGIAAFVAVIGLSTTAAAQIDSHFTALAATEVNVQDVGQSGQPESDISFPPDAAARVEALNGVQHAGVHWRVPLQAGTISSSLENAAGTQGLALVAVEASGLAAMKASVKFGRIYDTFHEARADRVAVLGSVAAARLGIQRWESVAAGAAIYVNGSPFVVIGVLADTVRMPELAFAVMIPTTTALVVYGPPTQTRAEMLVETDVGAAEQVARETPLAIRPDAPNLLKAIAAPDPRTLRGSVSADIDALFLMLAAVTLLAGAVGIANTTLVSVKERTPEIGLRRALGGRPRHIGSQFLLEAGLLGALGGMLGGCVGVAVVLTASVVQGWTAVLPTWTVISAPAVGAAVGLLAGAYPALRAAAIEPAEALRR